MPDTHGIHHLSAITGDAQRNLDFYTGLLGLRLVKHTVNFDDPTGLHLYYGDGVGTPGTILTFFVFSNGRRGQRGVGQVGTVRLGVPLASLGYWMERFIGKGVRFQGPTRRGDDQVIAFQDEEGLALELVATARAPEAASWRGATVPAEHAIRGMHEVEMWVMQAAGTIATLEQLGYRQVGSAENVTRLVPPDGTGLIAVRETGQFLAGSEGAGTVHHLAFRVTDDAQLAAFRQALLEQGLSPTDVRERLYFRSVYFREPGGLLFELATDGPGFTVDEPAEQLGSELKLPPQFEPIRPRLERSLPKLHVPS